MSIRSKLVVFHNMNMLIHDFDLKDQYINGSIDIKLRFIDFLLEFTAEEIDLGIEYIQKEKPELYTLVYPLILEYTTFGLVNLVDIEPELPKEEIIKEEKLTFWQKLKSIFIKQEKKENKESEKQLL